MTMYMSFIVKVYLRADIEVNVASSIELNADHTGT